MFALRCGPMLHGNLIWCSSCGFVPVRTALLDAGQPASAAAHRLVVLALGSAPARLLAAALDARAQAQDVLILDVGLFENLRSCPGR